MKKNLKKKIWIISTIILVTYIITLITNPSSWLSLLPIIITTTILTVGIPGYAIIKHTKESIEKAVEIEITSIKENNIKTSQNTKTIQKKVTNNNQNDNILNQQNEQKIKEKPKIKTKGTIH